MRKKYQKPEKDRKICAQTYISEETYQRWIKHIQTVHPRYTSISHFLEEGAEFKIQADNYGPNKLIGKVGPAWR